MSHLPLSRRNVVKGVGALSTASFLPGMVQAQTQELVIVATGGAFEKALKDFFLR